MRLHECSLCLWFLLSVCTLDGQALADATVHISRDDGLSDRAVKEIIQDHQGYLWIATRNGLNRYDGLNIVTYDYNPRSETRISARDIKRVIAKEDGTLLLQYEANRGFLDVLHCNSTTAQKLFLNEENGVIGDVEYIYFHSKTDDVYILTKLDSRLYLQRLGEEYRFDSLLQIQDFEAKPSSLFKIVLTEQGDCWMVDDKYGLLKVDSAGIVQARTPYDSLGLDPAPGPVAILHQDKHGRLWLSFAQLPGLWEFNEAAGYFTPFTAAGFRGTIRYDRIWEDGLGNVIVAGAGQDEEDLLFLITADDAVRHFEILPPKVQGVNDIFSADFEKLVFFGTNAGVWKVNQTKKRVNNFVSAAQRNGQLMSIRGITQVPDGPVIFVSDANQWYALDVASGVVDSIDFLMPHSERGDRYGGAKQLIYDSTGYVWGCRYHPDYKAELLCLDLSDTSFASYAFPQKIQSLALDTDGSILILSGDVDQESRLSRFNRVTKGFHHYFNADGSNPLRGFETTYLLLAECGDLWVGTTTGLIRIDRQDGSSEEFRSSPDNYYGLSSNHILCLAEDSEAKIWIGTDVGVCVYNPSTQVFVVYDTRDGLTDNNVCGILEDEKGNLWLSTYNGLSYFQSEDQSFRNFGVRDGFSHNEFNRFSFHKDDVGKFYFGGVNGLNVFHRNDLLERDVRAPILISAISYYDKEERAIVEHRHNLQHVKEVQLPAANRYFECSFAMADYTTPHLNQYQYKLEGRDIDWNKLRTQNELRFNNLPPGDYVLRIQGADRNYNLSTLHYALAIKVERFFYQKSWFVLLCISLLLLTIYIFHRIKLQQAINMERLRTKISSDLHDDVGGLLSGLAMQTELLEYSAKEKDKPKLKRISDMSRNAMAQMRDVIWATDARKDKFEDLLVRMKENAAEILFPSGITCYFDVSNINTEKKIPVPVRQNLYLIFKEAITNVAKHSNATRTDVKISKEGSRFTMSITDNGKEHSENGQATSLNGSGLKNMQMRAENINAALRIHKEEGYRIEIDMKAFV